MARILIYNNDNNRMETYIRVESKSMPYNTNGTLRVREFRGSSRSNTLWTSRNIMRAWNSTIYLYGSSIPVGFAFKRSWEGDMVYSYNTTPGVAFDVGKTFLNTQRNRLRNTATSSEAWSYVDT